MLNRSVPVHVILAMIRNSPSGKFVIVEGVDDIIVYRILINLYKTLGIQVIPAGGRDKVLEVFDEIKSTNNINKTIFIVDKDLWVFRGIPTEYQHERIITTSGYSIENDVFIDKENKKLLSPIIINGSKNWHIEWNNGNIVKTESIKYITKEVLYEGDYIIIEKSIF